ncbi:MAG: NAD(+)/NADH kinase [Candidatus Asgardarchaeia archaeon]
MGSKSEIEKILIVPKIDHEEVFEFVKKLISFLECMGKIPIVSSEANKYIKYGRGVDLKEASKEDLDLIITVGGDGTILYTSRFFKDTPPILTVNMGSRGFMAEIRPDEIRWALELIDKGEYFVEESTRLKVEVGSKRLPDALNEFLIKYCPLSKVIGIDLFIDGYLFSKDFVDSLIVSTTTGSTAHALAAGGPIVTPNTDVFTIVPVASLNLTLRPIVTSVNSVIELRITHPEKGVYGIIDGQEMFDIPFGEKIRISKSEYPVKFIRFRKDSFYRRIRDKLIGE